VVFDPVMTDTARYADVVLPATTFLERTEISRGYGAFVMQQAHAVIPPVGEARPNHEVFADLCRRLGLARPGDPETADEISAAVLGSSRRGAQLRASLDEKRIAFLESGIAPVQFVDAFPNTPDRKIHLVPEALDREAPLGLYGFQPEPDVSRYPLALISPSSDRTISSTLGELHRAPVPVAMHPDDAAPRGIHDGDRVRVFNALGSVRCFARLDSGVRTGVVYLPKGIWSHNTESGTTANALSPDTLTDLGGGACFNDARVDIEPAGTA
jgi:anaerobic selenocysteine-containing dehydrogenase